MKKRMIGLVLAVLMCMGLCAGAFASEEVEYTDQIWDVALAWNDALCIGNIYDMKLTGDFVSDVHEGSFEVTSLAHEYTFSDGLAEYDGDINVYYPLTAKTSVKAYNVKEGDDTVTYSVGTKDGRDVTYRIDKGLDIVGDPHQLVLLFSQIGDEKIDVQAEKDGVDKALHFELSGEALKNLVDAICHPIMLGGFGESADWDAITAQITVTLYYSGDDSAEITLESQSLGEALICSMEGVQSAENVELKITSNVDGFTEDSPIYTGHHVTPEERGDEIVAWDGEEPEMISVVDMMNVSYRPGWEEKSGDESAKDAVRAQLAGEAASAEEAAGE